MVKTFNLYCSRGFTGTSIKNLFFEQKSVAFLLWPPSVLESSVVIGMQRHLIYWVNTTPWISVHLPSHNALVLLPKCHLQRSLYPASCMKRLLRNPVGNWEQPIACWVLKYEGLQSETIQSYGVKSYIITCFLMGLWEGKLCTLDPDLNLGTWGVWT